MQIDRRNFLRSTGAGALSLTAMSGLKRASAQTLPGGSGGIPQLLNGSVQLSGLANLPSPSASGIDHIVVVTMENRSFDHFLGWLPGADGKQSGLSYTDRNGNSYPTWPLAPDYEGCGHPDPDHSYALPTAWPTIAERWMDFSGLATTMCSASATTRKRIFRSTALLPETSWCATATSPHFSGHFPQPHVPLGRSNRSSRRQHRILEPTHYLRQPVRRRREPSLLLQQSPLPGALGISLLGLDSAVFRFPE